MSSYIWQYPRFNALQTSGILSYPEPEPSRETTLRREVGSIRAVVGCSRQWDRDACGGGIGMPTLVGWRCPRQWDEHSQRAMDQEVALTDCRPAKVRLLAPAAEESRHIPKPDVFLSLISMRSGWTRHSQALISCLSCTESPRRQGSCWG